MAANTFFKKQTTGFALIMSLLVVSIVITAGLTILDVSIKQVRLSGTAKDSEIAFSATSAGVECGRFWRRERSNQMENRNGGTPDVAADISCFRLANQSVTPVVVSDVGGGGQAYVYSYRFGWGSGVDARCSAITTLVMVSGPTTASTLRVNLSATSDSVQKFFPGYPDSATAKTCAASGVCTILAVRGYNRSCTMINSPGTIEREVLLEY